MTDQHDPWVGYSKPGYDYDDDNYDDDNYGDDDDGMIDDSYYDQLYWLDNDYFARLYSYSEIMEFTKNWLERAELWARRARYQAHHWLWLRKHHLTRLYYKVTRQRDPLDEIPF